MNRDQTKLVVLFLEREVMTNLKAITKTIRQWLFEPQSLSGYYFQPDFDPDDITTYPTTKDIFSSGRFTPEERRLEKMVNTSTS